ncbi:MAG TPA: maleylpyruvate isomerase family mycothiol-dependent enzyme [Ilumatobacteraceae bacterium]|nr:maleylpyruvate isomerase family mycothiol-dependent enzyme [Ilumatobacteraceae bacterium]
MNQTVRDVSSVTRVDHDEAMRITAVEYRKFADLMRSLSPDEWAAQTNCTLWDVRAMCAHIVGSAASQRSPREFFRQKRGGKPINAELGLVNWWDGMNELQVRERAGLSTDELIAEWDEIAPRALKARTKMPKLIRSLPLLPLPEPVGRQKVSYLFDTGFTRDVWMHRIDIATAIGKEPDFDAGHDGRIVEDIVTEWARIHGEPFVLELGGPAGGTFTQGTDGEHVAIDTVDFMLILAERADGEGVLRNKLPL